MFGFFLIIHIIAGFTALLLFWIPLVTKKGGRIHKRVGWAYVYAMAAVAVTAVPLSLMRMFVMEGASADRFSFSLFLIFIAVLSSSSAYYGIRVLKHKKKTPKNRHPGDLAMSLLLLVSAVGCMGYGFSAGNALISYFPLIGLGLAAGQLSYWMRGAGAKNQWLLEHIQGMITCSIATITAFTVFGAPRLLGMDAQTVWLWFLPTVLLVPLMVWFIRKYRVD